MCCSYRSLHMYLPMISMKVAFLFQLPLHSLLLCHFNGRFTFHSRGINLGLCCERIQRQVLRCKHRHRTIPGTRSMLSYGQRVSSTHACSPLRACSLVLLIPGLKLEPNKKGAQQKGQTLSRMQQNPLTRCIPPHGAGQTLSAGTRRSGIPAGSSFWKTHPP